MEYDEHFGLNCGKYKCFIILTAFFFFFFLNLPILPQVIEEKKPDLHSVPDKSSQIFSAFGYQNGS